MPPRFQPSSAVDLIHYASCLVNALHRRYRKQIASAELIKAVYGARVLMMIVQGAEGMIVKRKLPYAIKEERNGAGES